jgi:phytol kinase
MRAIEFDKPVNRRRHSLTRARFPARTNVKESVDARLDAFSQRLTGRELHRRAWHVLPGVLPFLFWGVPHADPMSPLFQVIVVGLCLGLGWGIYARYHCIARRHDGECVRFSCVLGYAGSVIAATLLFPTAAEITFAVLMILAFGDGSATFFGKLLQGPTLPWNRQKTWSGLLAFLLFGLPTAALIYWGESNNPEAAQPGVTLSTAFLCVSFAVVAAAIAESLPTRLNDNIRVGGVSLVCLAAAHSAIVGW